MFTGLIQHQGVVSALRQQPAGVRLTIDAAGWSAQPALGDSVAVNGCCLTVAAHHAGALEFDVIPQTLSLTTLGDLQPGETVNLELAALASTPMGGHIVQGHVDGVGRVMGVDTSGGGWLARIQAPANVRAFIVDRGSVAVDGVSLTVSATGDDWFEVALIPETLQRTTLRARLAGARVNVEADYLARLVAEQVKRLMGSQKA